MAATVQIIEKNGGGGTPTDKTSGSVRFKTADNATVDLNNPIVKPPSGTNYSFEKWLRPNVSGGTYSQITNFKFYSDGTGSLGTGIGLYAKAVTTYAMPVLGTSTTGYADFFSYTSGSPLSLGTGPFTGTGEKGDHAVMLCTVDDTASGGVTPTETGTLAWDEI